GKGPGTIAWLVWSGLIFLCILLHELGHCYAARTQGGNAEEIVLWPLGGLAFVTAPYTPRSQLIVAAGGPAVTLLIALVAWPLFWLSRSYFPSIYAFPYVGQAAFVLVYLNTFLLVFNLVPLYPLDGGRIFHAILWGYFDRKHGHGAVGYMKATIATVWASRVTAVLGVIASFVLQELMLAIFMAWAWMDAERLLQRLRHGQATDSVFGYDFSRGYTSLDDRQSSAPGRKGPTFFRGFRRLFAPRKKSLSPDDERRLDELLEKIGREGMGSLSRSERRFLEKMSKRRHSR
ncbi:MAG: M50 family metallopeptidase, partial [Planctomycetota bacterium]|nr:M50 family metallopeptidase [Planctomycetota bacterium]